MKPLSPEWNADIIGRLYYAQIAMNNKRIGELLLEISDAYRAEVKEEPTYKYVETVEELIEAQNNGERIEFHQIMGLPEPKWVEDPLCPFIFCFPPERYRIVL